MTPISDLKVTAVAGEPKIRVRSGGLFAGQIPRIQFRVDGGPVFAHPRRRSRTAVTSPQSDSAIIGMLSIPWITRIEPMFRPIWQLAIPAFRMPRNRGNV